MNFFLTTITRATGRINTREGSRVTITPRIAFNAEWLREMGFVCNALAQFIPEHGGCSFVLCNENIPKYNELVDDATEKGGTLINVRTYRNMPQIVISGFYITRAELTHGDVLLARYEPGLIRMRKVYGGESSEEKTKIVTSHLIGAWLAELGFAPDECFTVSTEHGLITLRLQENAIERTAELVKYARENKLKLLQVQKQQSGTKKSYPFIDLPYSCLEKAGFSLDEVYLAVYEYGLIQLQKLDFVGLGF